MNEAQWTNSSRTSGSNLVSTDDDGKSTEMISTQEEREASWVHLSNEATDVTTSKDGGQKRDSASQEDIEDTWASLNPRLGTGHPNGAEKKTETTEDTRKTSKMPLASRHTSTGTNSAIQENIGNYFKENVHEPSERTNTSDVNVKRSEMVLDRLDDTGPTKKSSQLEKKEDMNIERNTKCSTNSSVENPFLKNQTDFEKRRDSGTKNTREVQRWNEPQELYGRHQKENPLTVPTAPVHGQSLYPNLNEMKMKMKDFGVIGTGCQKQNSAIGREMTNPAKMDGSLVSTTTDREEDLSESASTGRGSLGFNTEKKFPLVAKQIRNGNGRTDNCYLCGEMLQDFPYDQRLKCEMCPGKVFCHQCIEIYHKHPRRREHLTRVKHKLPEGRRRLVFDGPSIDQAIGNSFRPRTEDTGSRQPDLKSENRKKLDRKEDVSNTSVWKCTDCTFLNETLKEICEICGSKRFKGHHPDSSKRVWNIKEEDYYVIQAEEEDDDVIETMAKIKDQQLETMDGWQCTHCTFENASHDSICAVCYKTNEKDGKHRSHLQNSDDDDVDPDDDIYMSIKKVDNPSTDVARVQSGSRRENSTKPKDKNGYVCTKCEKRHHRNQSFCEQCMKTEKMAAKVQSGPEQQGNVSEKHLYSTSDQESVLCRKLIGEGLVNDSKRSKIAAQLIIQLNCSQEQALALSKKHTSFEAACEDLKEQRSLKARISKFLNI